MANYDNDPFNMGDKDLFGKISQDAQSKAEKIVLDVPFSYNPEIRAIREKHATYDENGKFKGSDLNVKFDNQLKAWTADKAALEKEPRLKDFAEPRVELKTTFLPQPDLQEAKKYDIVKDAVKEVFTVPNVVAKDRPDIVEYFDKQAVNDRQNEGKEFVDLELPLCVKVDPTKGLNDRGQELLSYDIPKQNELHNFLTSNSAFFDKKAATWRVTPENFEKNKEALAPYERAKGETVKLPNIREKWNEVALAGIYPVGQRGAHEFRIPNCVDKKIAHTIKKECGEQAYNERLAKTNAENASLKAENPDQMILISCQANNAGKREALESIKAEHNALIIMQSMPHTFQVPKEQAVKNQENKIVDLMNVVENVRANNPTNPIMLQHDKSLQKTIENNKGLQNRVNKTCEKAAVFRSWCQLQQLGKGLQNNQFVQRSGMSWQFDEAKNLVKSHLATQQASNEVKAEVAQKQAQKQELAQQQEQKQEQKLEKTQTKSKSRSH